MLFHVLAHVDPNRRLFVVEKKFGKKDWPSYRIVFFAGYLCGVGLIMMLSLGLVFMSKSVFQSNF